MSQPSWTGDRMAHYPSHHVDPHAEGRSSTLSYMPNHAANSVNIQHAAPFPPMQASSSSVYPPLPSMNPPYEDWQGGHGGLVGGYGSPAQMEDIQMNGHYMQGPTSNQWIPEHMNEHDPGLNTLNSAPTMPSHMATPHHGSAYPGTLTSLSSRFDNDLRISSKSAGKGVSGKGRPRMGVSEDQSGRESANLSSVPDEPMHWYKGIKTKLIPLNATAAEKEEMKEYNKRVTKIRKDHTRKQNRESAARSRARKQAKLDGAEEEVLRLRAQIEALEGEIRRLNEHIRQQDGQVRSLHAEIHGLRQPLFGRRDPWHLGPPSGYGAPTQAAAPAPNAASYPTNALPGPGALSPAPPLVPPIRGGGYLQQQAPMSLPTPSLNSYGGLMSPHEAMPLPGGMRAHNAAPRPSSSRAPAAQQLPLPPYQSHGAATAQMGFSYGGLGAGSQDQAPPYEAHGNAPGNMAAHPQGDGFHETTPPGDQRQGGGISHNGNNVQGQFPEEEQESEPDEMSGVETPQSSPAGFQQPVQEPEQQQQQQQQLQHQPPTSGAAFGPSLPPAEFANFDAPTNPDPNNASTAG
ncbi:hypothetical protein GGR52DRAFT_589537 [Hypoxylon sp. FL1284]|nr:hypothetical protein GGR52DRAFT_589537 [Hypoxylon sp. FL1284]